MKTVTKISLGLTFAVIVGVGLYALAYIVPVLRTEIDPDLGKYECVYYPSFDGGICHYEIIHTYVVSEGEQLAAYDSKVASPKRRRGH
jgi:hypothetical protein